jgi:PIN domain nuclease of toxin-antitoxin system
VRLLLDTHIFQWLAKRPESILQAEHALLGRPDVEVLVSSITIWELRIKWNSYHPRGDRKGVFDPADAIAFARNNGFELAALAAEDCASVLDAPVRHRDPFDEMLLVHAQRLGARLLTRGRAIADHPLALKLA